MSTSSRSSTERQSVRRLGPAVLRRGGLHLGGVPADQHLLTHRRHVRVEGADVAPGVRVGLAHEGVADDGDPQGAVLAVLGWPVLGWPVLGWRCCARLRWCGAGVCQGSGCRQGPQERQAVAGQVVLGRGQRPPDRRRRGDGGVVGGEALDVRAGRRSRPRRARRAAPASRSGRRRERRGRCRTPAGAAGARRPSGSRRPRSAPRCSGGRCRAPARAPGRAARRSAVERLVDGVDQRGLVAVERLDPEGDAPLARRTPRGASDPSRRLTYADERSSAVIRHTRPVAA